VLDPNQEFGYPRAAVSLPPDPCRRPPVAVQFQHPTSFDYGAKPHQKFSERLSKEQRNILADMRLQLGGRRGNIPRQLRELGFVGLKKFEPVMGGPGAEILEEDCERLRATFRADEWWASRAKKLEVTCKKLRRHRSLRWKVIKWAECMEKTRGKSVGAIDWLVGWAIKAFNIHHGIAGMIVRSGVGIRYVTIPFTSAQPNDPSRRSVHSPRHSSIPHSPKGSN
jgi:hypothetical protein